MYLEAKETARLYKLLSEKLGSDTTEAMFKYIDNKTERSVEATIKTLATKDDIADLRKEIGDGFVNLYKQMGENTGVIYKEMAATQENNIKWMFVFWIGQVAATVGFILLFLKK